MRELKIGTKVETPEGLGIICGYDLENSNVMRHIVKLDNGKLWNGNNPVFFYNQIRIIEEANGRSE